MEHLTYQDQVMWGTSLGMADDDETLKCYSLVKEYIQGRNDIYEQCEDSKRTKNFIDIRWMCGEAVHSLDLCNKTPSIKREDLIMAIEEMISTDEITIDGENIIKIFKKREYIDIYNCDRVFFVKND